MPKQLPNHLPKSLYRFFWDIDPEKLNPGKRAAYTIHRLLDKGNLLAINWTFNHFPRQKIIETVKERRGWDKKAINFWVNYLKLKKGEVRCLKRPYQTKLKSFWPY